MVGRFMVVVAVVGLLASRAPAQQPAPAAGETDTKLQSAQDALRTAKEHLQGAGGEYGGHRKAALQHIDQALAEVRQAIATGQKKENRIEKKEQHLEKKMNNLENKKQQLNK